MDDTQYIRKNFNAIWPIHVAGFTKLLTQLRKRFDGDLDLLLVLAVIGDRIRADQWSPELNSNEKLTRDDVDTGRQYPINIQSISEYSGIPRETVRRKVRVLQNKGWVTRDTEGYLAATPSAAKDLEEETENTIAYLAQLSIALKAKRDQP